MLEVVLQKVSSYFIYPTLHVRLCYHVFKSLATQSYCARFSSKSICNRSNCANNCIHTLSFRPDCSTTVPQFLRITLGCPVGELVVHDAVIEFGPSKSGNSRGIPQPWIRHKHWLHIHNVGPDHRYDIYASRLYGLYLEHEI